MNSIRNIVRAVRNEKISDITVQFPLLKERINDAVIKYEALIKELEIYYNGLKDIEDQKMFALRAVETVSPASLFDVRAGKSKDIREFLKNRLAIDKLIKLMGYK